jgi:alkanesulfonate monooxygenase SsuD/methylene tetrahydromethanopterin reductase-like flavin-dependent oxidoreductase (luciferase family)
MGLSFLSGLRPMALRFGIVLPHFATPWPELLGIARRAEAAGYDDVWASDHLLGIPDPETPVLEAWTTLSALAGATERIGLGTLVLASTFRPPRVLAKSVQTLVEIAGPRCVLGLGAGWHEEEHRAFGLDFPPLAARRARLEETVDAVRELAPGVPILLGGAGTKTLELAARKADLWNAPGDRLDDLPGLVERFEERRRASGREVEIVARVGVLLGADAEERLARRTSPWTRVGLGPLGFVGDADEIARRIELHRALGVTRFVIGFSRRDLARGVLEDLAESVLARYR